MAVLYFALPVFDEIHGPPPLVAAHAILDLAIDDNNRAPTSVEIERRADRVGSKIVRSTTIETYDEVRKREHDQFAGTVTTRRRAGRTTTVRYTLDLIFMDGVTCDRTSLGGNRWHVQKGQIFKDPVSGLDWVRGRFRLYHLYDHPLRIVRRSAGIVQLHVGQASNDGSSTDLWMRQGPHPYVVREDYRVVIGKGSARRLIVWSDRDSGFGEPVNIHAPSGPVLSQ